MPTISTIKGEFMHRLTNYTLEERSLLFYIFSKEILGLGKQEILLKRDEQIDEEVFRKFRKIADQLFLGQPYQQVLGKTDFYGMDFFVDENVLIPRPETEELLEIAIREIKNLRGNAQRLKILDIGTGSGIIPLVLKKYFPKSDVSSIDISEKALQTARRNADHHKLEVNFIHADYLHSELAEKYDMIISNPPYIGIEEETEIAGSVKDFEPQIALFSPTSDALIFYRKIAEDTKNHLNDNGLLFLEINQKLGPETLELYEHFSSIQLLKDLSENDRFIYGRK